MQLPLHVFFPDNFRTNNSLNDAVFYVQRVLNK